MIKLLHKSSIFSACCSVTQSCPSLCNPVDCSPPGSSVHEILQARILEWVAISFSRGASQPRDRTGSPALQADALSSEPPKISERYTHLNAEFQRIARRDKKAFLSNQCKEIVENNRMGKTRDLFKKIRYTKGTFHAKMGTIKDRNGMNLIEAEDIQKRWQEYTEELYKKDLHDQDNHDGVITHLEPDILE